MASIFDPVWKMLPSTVADTTTGNIGNPASTVAGDPVGSNPPKYKFNYTVAIAYNAKMLALLAASNGSNSTDPRTGSIYMNQMAFQVKTASRPNPTVVYQDINFYNYRTKIATKVDYGTMTITFYDDVNNNAHDIYTLYLQSISPIANVQNAIFAPNFDGTGINPQLGDPNVSSIGALPNEQESGLINTITVVHQMPLNYSNQGTAGSITATQVDDNGNDIGPTFSGDTGATSGIIGNTVTYVYMNPKVINFTLDDLDMTQSDVTTVSLTFTYDTVYISNVPISVPSDNQSSTINPIGASTSPTGSSLTGNANDLTANV